MSCRWRLRARSRQTSRGERCLEPEVHGLDQWGGAGVAHTAGCVRRASSDLLLDRIEKRDAFDGFGCDRRLVRLHQVEELAPDMRHARSFLYQAVFIELVEARVGVGLEDATEVCQVPLRMFALAVRRVGEPDCRSIERTGGAIVADIGPSLTMSALSRGFGACYYRHS